MRDDIKLKSVHGVYGQSRWEDYSDKYEQGIKNKNNMICVYVGVTDCVALMTQRGRVLATNGISVAELQFIINRGYVL